MKPKTNKQILRSLLLELSEVECEILNERIYQICEVTIQEIDTDGADVVQLISKTKYVKLMKRIQKSVANF